MPFEDITLPQLRAATKDQIVTAITTRLQLWTKRQLIIFVLACSNIVIENMELTDLKISQDGPNGQVKKLFEVFDPLGNKLRSSSYDWTYYPNGQVNEIIIKTLDASNILIKTQIIKHYLDGRKPILTTV